MHFMHKCKTYVDEVYEHKSILQHSAAANSTQNVMQVMVNCVGEW